MKLSFSLQHRRASFISKALWLTLALPCAAAWAQADGKAPTGKPESGGFIGLGVGFGPTYQGSDQQRTGAQPIGEYRWANGLYVGGRDGLLGMQMNATPQLQLGLAIGLDVGRKESDSSHLAGMGDIAAKATLNAYAKMALSEQFGLSAGVQLGLGSTGKGDKLEASSTGKGSLLNLGASYSIPLAQSTRLSLNAGATLANADYMQDYFGVNALQSRASGYRLYTPSAGLRDVSVGLGLHHQFDRNWMLIGGLTSTRLSSAANDSPLARKSTSLNTFAAVAYSF